VQTIINQQYINYIMKSCYENTCMYEAVEKNVNFLYFVKHELVHIGFSDLGSNKYLVSKLLPMIKQRIFDNAQQDKRGKISISTKCFTYQYLIDKLFYDLI